MDVSGSKKNRTITWLHIPDIHFQDSDPYDRNVVLRALISAVRQFRTQGRCPDLIFFTGDIAHGGKEKEYVHASTFFDNLLHAAELSKKRLFIVPGNHDVDRDAAKGLERTLSSEEDSVDFFSPNHPQYHFNKLTKFREWYNSYFTGIREWPQHSTCQILEVVEVSDLCVGILPINSALFCLGDDDHSKLWIGRRCLDEAIEQLKQLTADLRIALVHHPLDWLHDGERSNIKALLRTNVDFVLRGHLHESEAEVNSSQAESIFHFAAGACYQTRKYPMQAFLARVDYDAGEVRVCPIRYEDKPNEWTLDTSLFSAQSGYEGVFSVQFAAKENSIKHQKTVQTLSIDSSLRLSLLEKLDRESRARCVVCWQAAGVSRNEALKLVEDLTVGLPKPEQLPSSEKPLILLIGEIGAGKSLIAERFLQKAIVEARRDAEAPLPVFLEAVQIAERLQEAIEEVARNLGNPRIQGVTLIIEGSGGLEASSAYGLLNEARFLVGAWPKTTVLITSTPTPIFDREEEVVQLPRLTEQEIFKLIARISGKSVPAYIVIEEGPLAEAVRLPLFAVLIGIFLRESNERTPLSTGGLLSNLVERALGKTKENRTRAEQLLRQLAVLSTDHGGGPVYVADIAPKDQLQPLLDSGLVVERSDTLRFSLQLLTFWFAAQSLANGSPTLDELLQDAQRLEHWQYPLVIFIASCSHIQVSNVFGPTC